MNHKDLYINKKTFKCLEGEIPKGIDWLKIPEEAEECYYFDGNDPEGIEELSFYKDSFNKVWCDSKGGEFSWLKMDREDIYHVSMYIKTYGKLVWKCDVEKLPDNVSTMSDTVNNTTDFVHHPKHYTSDDCGVEAIEVTSLLPACISNAVKYVWRCGKKDEDLQELKKALWYINYSIDNDLPSFVDQLSDSLEFQSLVEKVKSHWTGNKYMFIDAVYWGNQETMKKSLELMIQELET